MAVPLPHRGLLLALFGFALCPVLRAAAVGTNHPASGAYAPVAESSWATASWPLGASFTAGAGSTLQVAVYSAHASQMVLEIYQADTGASAAYDYLMARGPDNIWRAAVAGAPQFTLYAFRAWGPNWPYSAAWTRGNSSAGFVSDCDAQGNRFNPNKVLFDPYAREISHNTYTPAMAAIGENYSMYTSGGANISSSMTYQGDLSPNGAIDCRNVDDGPWAPKSVALVDTTSTGTKPGLAQKDAIIYEAHVKGLTAHPSSANLATLLSPYSGFQDAANVPASLRGTYAGAAYMAGYLKDLGFNTIELLPVHETDNADDSTTAPSTSGGGYWSYWTYGFFAPDRRYASNQALGGPTAEFKNMVAAFHAAGIEVYLDVVYNHSGEGGVWDATTADQAEITFFRGLDNQSYYTLVAGTPQYYWVSTGVGTNLNAGSAPMRQLLLDSLTYWTTVMGVDGFRFDEAAELGRNGSSNFSGTATTLTSIASLAASDNFKIIAEPWDGNDGGEIGNFPAGWACWNGNYRDSIRMFMTGNLTGWVNSAGDLGYADAFNGDPAKMTAEGGPQMSVNMIDCHDGFNMTDLVSYGTAPTSLQWPFGPEAEGGTDNSSSWGGSQTLRRQAIRDFWTYQVLSRGLPMMIWGDETGRTVNGNNNSYNIDSVATWTNYNLIGSTAPDSLPTDDQSGGTMPYDNDLGTFAGPVNANFFFLQYLLHLRAAHVAFRQGDFTSMAITFTKPDAVTAIEQTTDAAFEAYVHGSQVGDTDFLVLPNVSTGSVQFTVPAAPAGTRWIKLIDTSSSSEATGNFWSAANAAIVSGSLNVAPQSIVVLQASLLVPSAPAGLTAVAGNGQVSLSWSPTAGATSYVIERATAAGGPYAQVGTATAAAFVDTSVSNGTVYYYEVEAVNGNGTGAASAAVSAPPGIILVTPASQAIATGGSASIAATGYSGSQTFQWYFAGAPIAGATSASLNLSNVGTNQGAVYGSFTVALTGSTGTVLSAPATLTVSTTARLLNLSSLGYCGSGGQSLAAGFVLGGSGSEPVLVRGIGPALGSFGLSGVLPDPSLTLYNSSQQSIATNTGWSTNGQESAIVAADSATGAFALTPGSADCALDLTLGAALYSASVQGVSNDAGTAMAEVYDGDPSASAPSARLINISTRAPVGAAYGPLTAGFVVSGGSSETVLIRGIGPTLASFNVSGSLPQPQLTLFDASENNAVLATNAGWGGLANTAAVFAQVNAFSLPATSADAALVVTLPPGNYSTQLTGVNGSSGVGLIEVYEVP